MFKQLSIFFIGIIPHQKQNHGISENDDGRLWRKVQEKLNGEDNQDTEEFHIICDEVTVKKNPIQLAFKDIDSCGICVYIGSYNYGNFPYQRL